MNSVSSVTSQPSAVVQLKGVSKSYAAPAPPVLQALDFQMTPGEAVALVGRSGSGKTTLLNVLAGLVRPDAGEVVVAGADLFQLSDAGRTKLRREHLGVIYQAFNLLPTLNARENLEFPLALLGRATQVATIDPLLQSLGLADLADRMPSQLSGGEQQRLAVGRALVHQPRLVLADEPTGNLDLENAHRVIELLVGQCRQHGATLLLVTHSSELSARMDRTVEIRDGKLHAL